MSYEKFKEVVFNTAPSNMKYHFFKHGLFISSLVISVENYYDDAGTQIHFDGGNFHIWKDNKITECRRPANLLIECEVCFDLANEYGDHIGYLYVPEK